MRPSLSRRLGPWRRFFQWGATATVLAVPFVRLDSRSLLRIDLPTLTLEAFGRVFRFEELHLFLLLCIALILGFLLLTMVLGRVWCGWACPQTTLSDVVEWTARRLGLRLAAGRIEGSPWRRTLLHLCCAALALLVAANLVWYFISPYDFFSRLLEGQLAGGVLLSLGVVAGTIYLDLAFLRRLLCREFCPYGRFQTVLVEPGTLTLHLPPQEASRCISCGACVRACPTGVDIRRGFQVECINCGRCLDACREVMSRRGQSGLIRYAFGTEGRGWRSLFTPRTLLLLAAVLAVSTILAVTALSRPGASLKLARAPAPTRHLADGREVSFFRAYVTNRGEAGTLLTLSARFADGTSVELRGPTNDLALAGGERRQLDFALVAPSSDVRRTVLFQLQDGSGRMAASAEALLVPPPE